LRCSLAERHRPDAGREQQVGEPSACGHVCHDEEHVLDDYAPNASV
jgi:hypothetical protein